MRDTKKKQIKVVVRDKNRIQISETSATYTDGMTLLNTKDLLLGTGLSGYIDEVRISNIVRTFIKTDIDNPHTNRKAEIYPNPASGSFVLRSLSGNCHINIMSVNGKVLLSKNTEGSVTEAIDISNYEKGIYIVQLIQENRTFTTKLIIK